MIKTKTTLILLILLSFVGVVAAYWATTINVEDAGAPGHIIIGSGATVHTATIVNHDATNLSLVPVGQINDPTTQTDLIQDIFRLRWNETLNPDVGVLFGTGFLGRMTVSNIVVRFANHHEASFLNNYLNITVEEVSPSGALIPITNLTNGFSRDIALGQDLSTNAGFMYHVAFRVSITITEANTLVDYQSISNQPILISFSTQVEER